MEEFKKEKSEEDYDDVKRQDFHHKMETDQDEKNPVRESKNEKKSDNFWKITTVVLIVLLAIVALRGGITSNAVVEQPADDQDVPSVPLDMDSLVENDAVKGDEDAPVTIIEWSDYECPFCARFYSDTFKQIDERYIKTGKVKFVFRDFPLSFHANAQKAAEAAECAGEQDKYYEMHNLLFEKGVAGGVASFKQFAQQIGLNTADFNTCLDSGAMASEISKDMNDGLAAGIQGTPGFVINGQVISGAQPFAAFQQVIEAALAE